MREIKFRGYNGMNWVYSSAVDFHKDTDTYYMLNPEYDEWEMVNKVGQYTGLKDKNEKEIYEGDLLHRQAHQDFFVDFHEGYFCVRSTNKVQQINWKPMKLIELLGYDYEVIGNIYESIT